MEINYSNMKHLLTTLLLLSALAAVGQDVESEIGFVYMKAEYLMETERYDEAVSEYTKVIKADPTYKDSYSKRAQAKYALGSYDGAKSDIMQMIPVRGLDKNSVKLLGLTESKLGNHTAAVASLILAHDLEPRNAQILDALVTSAARANDATACSIIEKVTATSEIKAYLASVCSGDTPAKLPKTRGNKKGEDVKPPKTRKDDIVTNDQNPTTETPAQLPTDTPETPVVVEEEEVEEIDDTVNEIVIDEDLTVVVKNGLGSRRIIDQPSILLLSEKAGEVTVDICVSKAGRVESAKINESETNINTESLKSLAVRKAKEFWFGRAEEQCGTIVLVINGG